MNFSYRELQKIIRKYRDQGLSSIKLNLKKIVLLKEYARLTAIENSKETVTNIQDGIDKAIEFVTKNGGVTKVLRNLDASNQLQNQFETKGINNRYDPNYPKHKDSLRYLKALYVSFCTLTKNQFEITADQLLAHSDMVGFDW